METGRDCRKFWTTRRAWRRSRVHPFLNLDRNPHWYTRRRVGRARQRPPKAPTRTQASALHPRASTDNIYHQSQKDTTATRLQQPGVELTPTNQRTPTRPFSSSNRNSIPRPGVPTCFPINTLQYTLIIQQCGMLSLSSGSRIVCLLFFVPSHFTGLGFCMTGRRPILSLLYSTLPILSREGTLCRERKEGGRESSRENRRSCSYSFFPFDTPLLSERRSLCARAVRGGRALRLGFGLHIHLFFFSLLSFSFLFFLVGGGGKEECLRCIRAFLEGSRSWLGSALWRRALVL